MKIVKKAILLLLFLGIVIQAFPQQKKIVRGRIIEKGTTIAVIGANVVEYDKEDRIINGTISNVNGDFVLEMKDLENIIRISVIGYNTTEIDINVTGPMTIEMESSKMELEEVVVTAVTKTRHSLTNIDERDIASSSVKVSMIEMQEGGFLSASDALQGKVSGLDIIAASGDPGSGSQLVIRGLSSMGNSQPLIVIDGIPQFRISSDFDLSSADSEDISALVNIALQDIKSIEVLKDAGSTAVFGSKGADGVLLIETFSGKLGKVQFDYQYKNSVNFQPSPIPMLNGDEYVMLQLEEWHNALGVFDIAPEIAYDKDFSDFHNYSANTDWLGAITQSSTTHDHYFKVSGGGQKTRFFTSFSYVDEGGTTINTNSTRFSTRVNLDYYFSKKLLFTVQFNYTKNNTAKNLKLNDRNVRNMAYIKSPNMSIWEYDEDGVPTGEYFTPINSYQGSGNSYFNPVAISELGKSDQVENQLQNTFRLRYSIVDWLVLKETVSFQYQGSKAQTFLPYSAVGSDWLGSKVNLADEDNTIGSQIRTETQLAFNSPFENVDHVLSGALSWITDQSSSEWMDFLSSNIPTTSIQDPAINAQLGWSGSGSSESRSLGALANVNYKYKDRYMIQTIVRDDAHSAFGINNRWGLFSGISAGWRFSSEPFMQGFKFLDESMLRASWGVAGRQPTDTYARFATYESTNNGSYITNPSIIPTQIQLNNLKWEKIESWDVGLNLNFFNYRIYLQTAIYLKTTSDLLFNKYEIPESSGYDVLKYLNGGTLENKGWELMMDFKIIQGANFGWSVNFNTSQNRNSFVDLPDNFNTERSTSISNGEYPLRVMLGEPIGSFFGFRYKGVYPTDADALARDANGNLLVDEAGVPMPMTYKGTYIFRGGDAIYEDINKDGVIDLNDVVYIGDSNPDFIGGFGSKFKYKNFNLSFSFHFRVGFDIINGVAIETEGMNNRNNQSKVTLNRWRVQGQDEEGMLPRAYMNHPANNLGSDRYVEPGDYLRLINTKLGYRLNEALCSKLGVGSVNFAISARKLITLTNYSGQDPEVGQDASDPFWIGVDNANTPPPRMVTFSISVGF